VAADGLVLGAVGEIDPGVLERYGIGERVAWLEVDLAPLVERAQPDRRYHRVSRYPSSDIDLAFVLDEAVPAATLTAALRSAGGETVVDVRLFDVYRGTGVAEGHRGLAYRLRLQAPDRTLTDADVAAVRERCIAAAATVGASLRA
jgi:phenylalanyl-tRNA synthetase beta chain